MNARRKCRNNNNMLNIKRQDMDKDKDSLDWRMHWQRDSADLAGWEDLLHRGC